jgi:hypothetical protein
MPSVLQGTIEVDVTVAGLDVVGNVVLNDGTVEITVAPELTSQLSVTAVLITLPRDVVSPLHVKREVLTMI